MSSISQKNNLAVYYSQHSQQIKTIISITGSDKLTTEDFEVHVVPEK